MKRLSIVLLAGSLLALFTLVASSKAAIFSIDSAPYNDGVHAISPYTSTFDGHAIQSWCIELDHTVSFGQQFQVTAINLADFMPGSNQQAIYLEVGYLMIASLGHIDDIAVLSNINRAIWYLTTPNSAGNAYLDTPGSQAWVDYAQGHPYTPGDLNMFTLLIHDPNQAGQNQMVFTGAIPEPSVNAMIFIGFASLLAFLKFGRDQRKDWRKRR